MKIGTRAKNNWGAGDDLSVYAVGDVIYVPPDAPAVEQERCFPGLHRVESVFSISEGPEFYYRLAHAAIRGNRIITSWWDVSDRLQVTTDGTNYTKGWVLLS